jgi:hypothetical protein
MPGDESEHPLFPLLQERLPRLGLNVETYAPYVLALFPIPVSSAALAATHESKVSTDINSDIEGWDDVVELLQASSDEDLLEDVNDDAWVLLRKDLIHAWTAYRHQVYEQQKAQLAVQEEIFQKRLEEERELAIINEMTSAAAISGGSDSKESRATADSAKQALLNRFGYEEDDADDIVGVANTNGMNVSRSATSKLGGKDEPVNALAASSQTKSGKGPGITATPSKREEQQKTKLQQQQKVATKEERRKRATKGERRG